MSELGLGSVGVALTVSDTYLDEAAQLERLGYSAIWLPGGGATRARSPRGSVSSCTPVPTTSCFTS